jgi:hypothetical protein
MGTIKVAANRIYGAFQFIVIVLAVYGGWHLFTIWQDWWIWDKMLFLIKWF